VTFSASTMKSLSWTLVLTSLCYTSTSGCDKDTTSQEVSPTEFGFDSEDATAENGDEAQNESNTLFFCNQPARTETLTKYLDPHHSMTHFRFCINKKEASQSCYILEASVKTPNKGRIVKAERKVLHATRKKEAVSLPSFATKQLINKGTTVAFKRCCVSQAEADKIQQVPEEDQCQSIQDYSFNLAFKAKESS